MITSGRRPVPEAALVPIGRTSNQVQQCKAPWPRGLVSSLLAIFIALVIPVTPAMSQTAVSGSISNDAVWSADNSPYVLTGTVTIRGSATLTIDPGVVVECGTYS